MKKYLSIVGLLWVFLFAHGQQRVIYYPEEGSANKERLLYAVERALSELGGQAKQATFSADELPKGPSAIVLATKGQLSSIPELLWLESLAKDATESYIIVRRDISSPIYVVGADETGLLYGCLAAAKQGIFDIRDTIFQQDQPEMVLRGTAIGLQKTEYLPGRDVYEYPYTEELFPWFYDKDLWIDYLDKMLENRYNTLYLWNGHPFSSLVKLEDYPYALEVSEETFRKNEEIFNFLTSEANKRGIWVIQMFYNILLPKPFADRHGLKTQERNRIITPPISDYTRKSIAAFVAKYPNVGLLVTLGEAMEGVGQDDIDWFTKTIIPGVHDGLAKIKSSMEPPIILRAHDTDAPAVMKAALPLYKNLYTMAKYNGEALTTYQPRGKWAELHRSLSRIGTVHIQNVHILANLEPFRYGSPDFIQKSVKAMREIHLSNGLHIYPQASYWDWPYTADKSAPRLLQLDRDWMWYSAWARYAWKVDREKHEEELFWAQELSDLYGIEKSKAAKLLSAIEEIGEISPKILRRFGITDGNRQTSSLGMLMTQLINPYRYGLFTLLYESEAPEGEMIIEYAEKEFRKEPHIGETPVQVANEIVQHAERAVASIRDIGDATKNNEEFQRWLNDIYIHRALARHYSHKVKSAVQVLEYKYTGDVRSLQKAIPDLEASVEAYRTLTALTKGTYLYANSMQTKQRKIPMRGVDATYKHWEEMLPVFETELSNFKKSTDSLSNAPTGITETKKNLRPVEVDVLSDREVTFSTVKKGAKLYTDQELVITHLAPELEGLEAIMVDSKRQKTQGTNLRFHNDRPVKLLVGYFNSDDKVFAPKPVLEIDASANDYSQAEAKIRNAMRIQYMPMVDIHTYTFSPGANELKLPKGEALIIGFIDDRELTNPFNADIDNQGDDLDDLFGYYLDTKL